MSLRIAANQAQISGTASTFGADQSSILNFQAAHINQHNFHQPTAHHTQNILKAAQIVTNFQKQGNISHFSFSKSNSPIFVNFLHLAQDFGGF